MTKLSKYIIGSTCTIAGLMVSTSMAAVDPATAAGNLAEIGSISVQAKANLSEAANGGNVDDIAEAGKRSDAVDAAMAQAQEAFSEMERALANGDEDTAKSAADDLMASLEKAADALNGVIPEEVVNAVKEWKESKKNTGGGAGRPYDPPNMYDVPWNSRLMRNFYQNHFGNNWSSGVTPGDRDATPE
ncbi:hypothetical protein P4B35_18635 [Pontiellaceae bacterium B12227]|nr:hypothetical protein [Pontiellaceae bacterium B12227]